MLRIIGILVCLWSVGYAQPFWGTRVETNLPFLAPQLGFQGGWESDYLGSGVGVRVSATTLLLLNRATLDGYVRLALGDSKSVYFGGGVSYFAFLLCCADGTGGGFQWFHGVLGYQWKEDERSHWFIELNPGYLGRQTFIVSVVLGGNVY